MKKWKENGRCRRRQLKWQKITALFAILFLSFSVRGMAAETDLEESTAPAAGDDTPAQSETADREIISVEFPILEEGKNSFFDFVLDPFGLLYRTGAAKYGGGSVQEGATLLFRNREGEYGFSKYSDYLTVVNQGEKPVAVTVSATVSGLEGMELASADDFSESKEAVLYLAMEDETGRTQPLSAEEEVSISQVVEPGSWSFRMVGACNSDADWQRMQSVYPKISVRWYAEPVEETLADTEEDDPGEEDEGKKETSDSAEDTDSVEDTDPAEDDDPAEEPEDPAGTEEPEDSASVEEPPEESDGDDSEDQKAEISVSENSL